MSCLPSNFWKLLPSKSYVRAKILH
jgi:hypothetical protein